MRGIGGRDDLLSSVLVVADGGVVRALERVLLGWQVME